jgi:hypothetical protein
MPLAFPSHQGLIAPLWRRWPRFFNILAMGIGAAVPDVVDGVAGIFRGGLGQWLGHSLTGLFLLCLPVGLALTWMVLRMADAFAVSSGRKGRFARYLQSLNTTPPGTPLKRFAFVASSSLLGAFSHLLIDFFSHGNFMWFYPWIKSGHFFPDWWYIGWFEISVPGYRHPYTAGPHLLVWTIFSVLGIVLFFYPCFRGAKKQ